MPVSEQTSFLKRGSALLVVAGKRVAKIYNVQNGSLEPLAALRINPSQYTDKPEAFRNGNSGEPQRENDGYLVPKFLSELSEKIKNIGVPYERLFLFAPQQLLKKIRQSLPQPAANKLADEFSGNFLKHRSNELLDKIELRVELSQELTRHIHTSEEAGRILSRPKRTMASAS